MIQEDIHFWEMIVSVSSITRPLTYDHDGMINTIFYISDDKVIAIKSDSGGNIYVLGDYIIGQLHNANSNSRL